MSNLHEFFMLFVFMAGAASLILFFVTRTTQKMMAHDHILPHDPREETAPL